MKLNGPETISRREVLRTAMGATVSGMLPASAIAAESAMLTRPIPSSGEALPIIGLGTSRVFDVGETEAERAPRREVLRELVAAGASLVDSSPMYRRAEKVSGDLAAELGVTARIFWATKVWTDGQDAGVAQMERSMELFRDEQIDLMQVHNLKDWQTHIITLRSWKEAGRIRYIGLTTSRASQFEQMEEVIRATEPDFVQLNYSLGERQAEKRLLPLCADQGIATLINRPFMRGDLFRAVGDRPLPGWAADVGVATWGQFFLKFILGHPAATCAIPATRKAKHMIDNLTAGTGPMPDAAQRRAMADFVADL